MGTFANDISSDEDRSSEDESGNETVAQVESRDSGFPVVGNIFEFLANPYEETVTS